MLGGGADASGMGNSGPCLEPILPPGSGSDVTFVLSRQSCSCHRPGPREPGDRTPEPGPSRTRPLPELQEGS